MLECIITGRPTGFTRSHMGKNRLAEVPKEIATHLGLEDPGKYTFHSFRRSAATAAADAGTSTDQMVDFFGWANQKMTSEYISTSKQAVHMMADRLSKTESIQPFTTETDPVPYEKLNSNDKMFKNSENCILFQGTEKVLIFPGYSGEIKL